MKCTRFVSLAAALALLPSACGEEAKTEPLPTSGGKGPAPFDPGETYAPDVAASELSPEVTNPFFPAPVGATWVYEGETEDGLETTEVEVLAETKDVWGATARVVRDTVTLDGELIEDTWDWYAQDPDGHVWYVGEDTREYEDGEFKCTCGAWESGKDGALPGVLMLADPEVGDVYRQEFLEGEAEDVGEVVALDVSISVEAGDFEGCLTTRDRSAIDPELDELKHYCPGVGLVLTEEGDVREELVAYTVP